MENLDKFLDMDSMQRLDNTMQKSLKLRNKVNEPNRDRILAQFSEDLENIKEGMKAYFRKAHGWYPSKSEGTCKICSEKLVQLVNGDLIWGYFKTDTQFESSLLIKRTENGLHTIAEIKDREPSKVTHWWVEIGNLIIDLTAEQFNEYLKPNSQKYDRIELIFKDEPKAKRYFGEERILKVNLMKNHIIKTNLNKQRFLTLFNLKKTKSKEKS